MFAEEFPCLKESETARLIGPTIEGVGLYPSIDDSLRLTNGLPAWVIGDATGR